MKKETEAWIRKAESDFDTAKFNFNGGRYCAAVFFCQQAAEKAMKTDKRIIAKLKEFKAKVSKDYAVDNLIFFGSRVTGKPHRWSDIDLVIVSSKFRKMDFIQRGARMYDYWKLDYPVDFLCYTPEEFNRLKNQN